MLELIVARIADALDRLAKDGLGELDRVSPAAPSLHPIQSEPEMDGMAILGEVLGQAASLQQAFNAQKQLYKPQVPSPMQPQPNRQPVGQGFSGSEQNQTQCRTVTHPPAKGTGASTVQILCDGGNGGKGSPRQEAAPSPSWGTMTENMGGGLAP